jgi:hypothetical protein
MNKKKYDKFVEFARACARNAHSASHKETAAELWQRATEYQAKATELGDRPVIGDPPSWLPHGRKRTRSPSHRRLG